MRSLPSPSLAAAIITSTSSATTSRGTSSSSNTNGRTFFWIRTLLGSSIFLMTVLNFHKLQSIHQQLEQITTLHADTVSNTDSTTNNNNNNNNNNTNAMTVSRSSAAASSTISPTNNSTVTSTATSTAATQSPLHPPVVVALLYPNGLLGGYRNQVMRFVSLVKHAIELSDNEQQVVDLGVDTGANTNGTTNTTTTATSSLLVPSLLFSTFHRTTTTNNNNANNVTTTSTSTHGGLGQFFPIPFEYLFDVDHWNSVATKVIDRDDTEESEPSSKLQTETTIPLSSSSNVRLPLLVHSVHNHREDNNNDDDNHRHHHNNNNATNSCWNEPTQSDKQYATQLYHRAVVHSKQQQTTLLSPMTRNVIDHHLWLTPIRNQSLEFVLGMDTRRIRQIDYTDETKHCTNPFVYGGGKGAGRLWFEYTEMPKITTSTTTTKSADNAAAQRNTQLIALVNQALQPLPKWKHLAQQCIHHYLSKNQEQEDSIPSTTTATTATTTLHSTVTSQHNNNKHKKNYYVALHARVEVDMLKHKCGKDMEKNLTTILDWVDDFIQKYNLNPNHNHNKNKNTLDGTFIAVGREAMQIEPPSNDVMLQKLARDNWATLNRRSLIFQNRRKNKNVVVDDDTTSSSSQVPLPPPRPPPPLFECGEDWVDEAYYNNNNAINNVDKVPYDYYGSILPSMINFWLAVEAEVFVGVSKSSWSTDVWTTRYWMGRGQTNYEYVKDRGIVPISNGGLPPPHTNC